MSQRTAEQRGHPSAEPQVEMEEWLLHWMWQSLRVANSSVLIYWWLLGFMLPIKDNNATSQAERSWHGATFSCYIYIETAFFPDKVESRFLLFLFIDSLVVKAEILWNISVSALTQVLINTSCFFPSLSVLVERRRWLAAECRSLTSLHFFSIITHDSWSTFPHKNTYARSP